MIYLNYLRVPYKHQGRDWAGADCFGLLRMFYLTELGIRLKDYTDDYPEEWWKEQDYFLKLHRKYHFSQAASPPQKGDVVLFYNTSNTVGHCGIVLDDQHFLHMTKTRCAISKYVYGSWSKRIQGFYRYSGLKRSTQ